MSEPAVDEIYDLREATWDAELGIPEISAEALALSKLDYHGLEQLVARGCPIELALEIVR